jgi:hypothetical protein
MEYFFKMNPKDRGWGVAGTGLIWLKERTSGGLL